MYPNQSFIQHWLPIGTGLQDTKTSYRHWFNTNDPRLDIMFLKKISSRIRRTSPHLPAFEPLTMEGTTIPAGIQVKAITCNEIDQIINPLISKKYSNVLTLLRRDDGRHSYDECMKLLSSARQNGKIDINTYYYLNRSIWCPEMIDIDQYYIDGFYEYISNWYNGRAGGNKDIVDGIKVEVKIDLEGKSLLLPSTEIIQPNNSDISLYG